MLFDRNLKLAVAKSKIRCGSSSMVERQPSKLNVASSSLVSRSKQF